MGIHQADKRKGRATSVFGLFFMPAGAVLVTGLLFLALVLIGDSRLMAVGKGIEGLDAPALGHPLLLPCDRPLFGVGHRRVGLDNRLIQPGKKPRIVLPFAWTQAVLRGGHKTCPIFFAVFHQQVMPPRGLLFARDQFAQFSTGLVKPQLRKVEQGLERESSGHGGIKKRKGKSYAAPNNSASCCREEA